jgi:hypothetical protein
MNISVIEREAGAIALQLGEEIEAYKSWEEIEEYGSCAEIDTY